MSSDFVYLLVLCGFRFAASAVTHLSLIGCSLSDREKEFSWPSNTLPAF